MHFLSLMGWLIVVGVVVVAFTWRHEETSVRTGSQTRLSQHFEEGEWCSALESLTGSLILLFDSGLRVIEAGKGVAAFIDGVGRGAHLMDIVPPDIAPTVLEGVNCARRDGKGELDTLWKGRKVNITAVAIGEGSILMRILRIR